MLRLTLLVVITAVGCSAKVEMKIFDQFGYPTSLIQAGCKVELTCRTSSAQRPLVEVRRSRSVGQTGDIVATKPFGRQKSWKTAVTIANNSQLGWYYCADTSSTGPTANDSVLISYVLCSKEDSLNCSNQGDEFCFFSHLHIGVVCGRQQFRQLHTCEEHKLSSGPKDFICLPDGHKVAWEQHYLRELVSSHLPTPLYYEEISSACEYLRQDRLGYFKLFSSNGCRHLSYSVVPQMICTTTGAPLSIGSTISLRADLTTTEIRLKFFCGSGIKAILEEGNISYEPAYFHRCLYSLTFANSCEETACGDDIVLQPEDFALGTSKLEVEYEGIRSFVYIDMATSDASKILTAKLVTISMVISLLLQLQL